MKTAIGWLRRHEGGEKMRTKVLVVDDSAFTRRIVKNALNGHGFRKVIEAENARKD